MKKERNMVFSYSFIAFKPSKCLSKAVLFSLYFPQQIDTVDSIIDFLTTGPCSLWKGSKISKHWNIFWNWKLYSKDLFKDNIAMTRKSLMGISDTVLHSWCTISCFLDLECVMSLFCHCTEQCKSSWCTSSLSHLSLHPPRQHCHHLRLKQVNLVSFLSV